MRHDWHRLTVSRTAEKLGADPATGLAPTAAAERLARHGPNQLTASDKISLAALLLDQFRDFMILVLIAAAVISGLVGELADSIAILVIVLLNATIVSAIREGRRIFDNVRKFIRYTMTSNAGEIWTLSLAPLLGMPLPLLPIQILWINLVTDGLPGLALSLEPHERGIMRRAPRAPREPILSHGLGWHVLWIGLLIGVLSIGVQAWALNTDNPHWQTLVFNVLTFAQLFHVLAIRSEHESLWRLGLLSNPALLGAVAFTFALQLAVTYTPILQGVFHTQSLTASELLGCFILASVVIPAVELEKSLARRGLIYRTKPAEHDHKNA